MSQSAFIRWACWYGDIDLELTFPDDWQVQTFPMRGGQDIGEEGLRRAFANPMGTPTLAELARGKRDAVIVVDDLSRPTPAARVIPFIIEELARGGIAKENIRFIMGVAAHRPMTRQDCILKLGQEIVDNYQVRNHHLYENLAYLGKTKHNTPVFVNRDFLTADVKICVGSINPHGGPGFGGGAKLVLPGVAGIESIYNNHRGDIPPRGGLNKVDGNETREDMEEFARMAGLTAIVNVVVNERREIAACVVGDVVEAHRVGVGLAREVFATPVPKGWDVGVFNTYPKDVEWVQAGMAFNVWHSAKEPIVHESGTIVLACASSEGAGYHSLYGPEMRLGSSRGSMKRAFGNRHFIIFSPNINQFDLNPATRADAVLCRTWEAVVEELKKHHGAGTKVAVFPCSAIQLAV